MKKVNISEASKNLSKLIDEALKGEIIFILKRGKPVAKLIAFEAEKEGERKIGTAKGMISISPDFDDPLDDFREYSS